MEKFDLTVIGGGPAGYPAAIRAAQHGACVALVEKEILGGTCLNWGCIPTKTLIAASNLFHRVRHAAELGLKIGKSDFDYEAISGRKDEVVSKLRTGVSQLLKANGVKVLAGTASFTSRNRIRVKSRTDSRQLVTDKVIIATGAEPVMPNALPRDKRIVDSRGFLGLAELPETMIVMGGGIIGCEFACMAAQLGVEVTVAEILDDITIALDTDIRRELRRHMEKSLHIRVLTGHPLTGIRAGKKGVSGRHGSERLTTQLLLVSTGRRPVTAGLSLGKAGLEPTESGAIEIDNFCRTAASTIYAAGDATEGSTQLAHAATSQGITAAENACCTNRVAAETLIPACIFTSPEIGSVGLGEDKAKADGLRVISGKFPFAGLGRAAASGEKAGFVKWIADAETEQLLGAHAIGAHATELVAEAAVAIRAELTAEELARTVHCHPTFSEAWMEAAHAVRGECIHSPPKRRR